MANIRLLALQKKLKSNMNKAINIAEQNTKRDVNGRVVLPLNDEWRTDDWDDFVKQICQ